MTVLLDDDETRPEVDVDYTNTFHFYYTNYAGRFALRRVQVKGFRFGVSKYHDGGPQLFMLAWDFDKHATREFAVSAIAGLVQPDLGTLGTPLADQGELPSDGPVSPTVSGPGPS